MVSSNLHGVCEGCRSDPSHCHCRRSDGVDENAAAHLLDVGRVSGEGQCDQGTREGGSSEGTCGSALLDIGDESGTGSPRQGTSKQAGQSGQTGETLDDLPPQG